MCMCACVPKTVSTRIDGYVGNIHILTHHDPGEGERYTQFASCREKKRENAFAIYFTKG